MTKSFLSSCTESTENDEETVQQQEQHKLEHHDPRSLRDRLRQMTGFSWTVTRTTMRGITGISLTAVYASTVAATGLWMRNLTSWILRIFPSWLRYFVQPLLVLYYAPLFVLRNLTKPDHQQTQKQAMIHHQAFIQGWKEAMQYAEQAHQDGYRPVVVGVDGYLEMVPPPSVPESSIGSEKTNQRPSLLKREEAAPMAEHAKLMEAAVQEHETNNAEEGDI